MNWNNGLVALQFHVRVTVLHRNKFIYNKNQLDAFGFVIEKLVALDFLGFNNSYIKKQSENKFQFTYSGSFMLIHIKNFAELSAVLSRYFSTQSPPTKRCLFHHSTSFSVPCQHPLSSYPVRNVSTSWPSLISWQARLYTASETDGSRSAPPPGSQRYTPRLIYFMYML
jgi:hypothetical protein